MNGSSDGNALGTSKLEHALYVLAEERCLDCHAVGQIALNDAAYALMDVSELEVRVGKLAKVDDAKSKHLRLLVHDTKYTVTHDARPRVYSKDDLFHLTFII